MDAPPNTSTEGASVSLPEAVRAFREKVNDPLIQSWLMKERLSWDRLCAAMDAIEDTAAGQMAYPTASESASEVGTRYLLLYGIYQSLVVQQDAVASLRSAVGLETEFKGTRLGEIRRERILAAGHPTNPDRVQGVSAVFVIRAYLGKGRASLLVLRRDGRSQTEHLDPMALAAEQHRLIAGLVAEAPDELEKRHRGHRELYRASSLKSTLASAQESMRMIREGLVRDPEGRQEIVEVFLNAVREEIAAFSVQLAARGELSAHEETLALELDAAFMAISRLERLIPGGLQSKEDLFDAQTFSDRLESIVEGLVEVAKRIDAEYSV